MTNNKEPILIITPTELKFKFELRKQMPATLVLHNPAQHTVAFKIKTTSPKKYCVRPSTGFVLPQSKVPVQIMMSSQKEVPPDFNSCRDKFLVQSVKLTEQEAGNPINPDLFSKVGGKDVHEFKLKVSYTSVSMPSPVKENGAAESDTNGASKVVRQTPSAVPSADKAAEKEIIASVDETNLAGVMATLPVKTPQVLQGFSLLHLLITAITAYLIGRYFN